MWKRCVQRPENIMRYVNPRTQHADVPTPPHYSSLITHCPKTCSYVHLSNLKRNLWSSVASA